MKELTDDNLRGGTVKRRETTQAEGHTPWQGTLETVDVPLEPGEVFRLSGGGPTLTCRVKEVLRVKMVTYTKVTFEEVREG